MPHHTKHRHGGGRHGSFVSCVPDLANRVDDFDLWWHLKSGELIVRTGSLPSSDIFSYTTVTPKSLLRVGLADNPLKKAAVIFQILARQPDELVAGPGVFLPVATVLAD